MKTPITILFILMCFSWNFSVATPVIYDDTTTLYGKTTPTANISGYYNICLGSSANIPVYLSGATIYDVTFFDGITQWTVTGITASPYHLIVSPPAVRTYTIVSVIGDGCSGTGSGAATVIPGNPPSLHILSCGVSSFCPGSLSGPISLDSSEQNTLYWLSYVGNTTPIPGTIMSGTGNPFNFTGIGVTGSIQCIAENTAGCQSIMNGIVILSQNALPGSATVINGSNSICANTMGVTYSIPNAIPNATSYAWSVPVGSTITGNYGTTITVDIGATSGNITVAGVNSCGSGTAFILPITVTAAPVGTINASPGTVICAGTSVDLNVTSNQSGSTFLWSTSQTDPDITVTPMNSQSYSVTITGTNSCTATASIAINVHNSPNVTLNLTEDNFCTDVTSAVLSGGLPIGGVYSGDYVLGGNIIHPNGEGIYIITYTYTDGYGCSDSATDLLTINAVPVITVTNLTNPIYADTPPFSVANQFSPIGGTCSGPGVINNVFYPGAVGQGVYIITYTYTHPITGCIGSDDITIFVGATGVDEVTAAANMINMFPNPTSSTLKLAGIDMQEIKTLRIMNLLGETVYIADITAEDMAIDVSSFAPGTYIVAFMDADGLSVGKYFVKE